MFAWVDGVDLYSLISELTGQDAELHIADVLKPLELSWDDSNRVDCAIYGQHADIVRAAFKAGYLLGRNPDLVLLRETAAPEFVGGSLPAEV